HHLPIVTHTSHLPPTATLFPYTTLFRSEQRGADEFLSAASGALRQRVLGLERDDVVAVAALERTDAGQRARMKWLHLLSSPKGPDRKSTRLNSSHRTISYAVFCLKKKTQ